MEAFQSGQASDFGKLAELVVLFFFEPRPAVENLDVAVQLVILVEITKYFAEATKKIRRP